MPAGGGEPEVLTKPDPAKGERDHYFPSVLPGGRGVLFTITAGGRDGPPGGRPRSEDRPAQDVDSVRKPGRVHRDGTPDLCRWRDAVGRHASTWRRSNVLGDPVPLVEQVLTLGAADFTISRRGTLVYVPVDGGRSRSLVWVTRQGVEEPIAAPPRAYVVRSSLA